MVVARNLRVITVITLNEKRSLKEVVPIAYTLEKRFLAVATFDSLRVVSFQTEFKTSSVVLPVRVFFGFSEKRKPSKYCL